MDDYFGDLPVNDPIWDKALAEAKATIGENAPSVIRFAFEIYDRLINGERHV